MKMKMKITALMLVVLMLLVQMPFTAFAAETTTGTLTPATLEDIKVGDWYYRYFNFESDEYTSNDWVIDGELPTGMELKNSTASDHPVISGVPTTAGSYTFTMKAKRNISGEPTVVFEQSYTWVIGTNTLRIKGEPEIYGYSDGYGGFSHNLRVNYNLESTWSMEPAEGYTLPDDLKLEYDEDEGNYKLVWAEPQTGKYYIKVTATCNGETASQTLKLIVIPYAGCEHAELSYIEGTAATCMSNGTPDLWYCDDCETYFYDEKCDVRAPYEADDADELYTTGFHTDENDDKKCDTCGKTMPVFKKVTTDDDVTGYGMYIIVSQIDGKYYTLKAAEKTELDKIEAVEIEKNSDGTFSYPESGVMMLKTLAAAPCEGELGAGSPRYSFGATVYGVPYVLTSEDYSGSIRMEWSNDSSKYGCRIELTEEENANIASVYSEYWGGEGGKGGGSGIFSAYEEADGDGTKRYFSFATSDTLTAKPVELYKLTYVETMEGDKSYTLSDAPLSEAQDAVTNNLASMVDAENNKFSVVSGISNALTEGTVEEIIEEAVEDEELTETEFTVHAYATINAKSEETADGASGDVTAITYEVKPCIAIKDAEGNALAVKEIPDGKLNGTKMTVTLCVGAMTPEQIIHCKSDGTEEYFYAEDSDKVKNDGAKSFQLYKDHANGNLVTFEIDSFSEIKILAAAEPEKTVTAVTSADFTLTGFEIGRNIKDISLAASTETATMIKPMSGYEVSYSICTDEGALTGDFSSEIKKTADPAPKFEAGNDYYLVVKLEAKDGYSVSGLKKDKIFLGGEDKAEAIAISGKTVTAVFLLSISAEYTVTLKGTASGATGAGSYHEGDTVRIYAGAKSGYSFGGWTTEDVTLTDAQSANAEFTMPSKKVTVSASWKKDTEKGGGGGSASRTKTVSLKFITMGGSAVESMEVDKNGVATAPKAPVREGYDFAGWYIDKDMP